MTTVATIHKPLFSGHYLDTRLPLDPAWAEDPRETFRRVRERWAQAQRFGATWNESQTEDEFVKPVLNALGWS